MALAALLHRRTIRQYEPEYRIPKDTLQQIVNAGLQSPTGMNTQDVDLIVCTNRAKIDQVTSAALAAWPADARENFHKRIADLGIKNVVTGDASCVIFLAKNDRTNESFNLIDTGIMTMGLIIAAENFGLSSMPLGCLLWKPEKVEEALGIAKGKLVMAVAIGKARPNAAIRDKETICKATYIE